MFEFRFERSRVTVFWSLAHVTNREHGTKFDATARCSIHDNATKFDPGFEPDCSWDALNPAIRIVHVLATCMNGEQDVSLDRVFNNINPTPWQDGVRVRVHIQMRAHT